MGDSWSGIVDVGSKPIVRREAIATGMILLKSESIDAVANGSSPREMSAKPQLFLRFRQSKRPLAPFLTVILYPSRGAMWSGC